MLSRKLLPARPKPLPNEVLSSWFARVAEANAVKQHSLAFMRLGATKPPWTWALDLEGGEWFLRNLCKTTGTSLALGRKTTLFDYLGLVFPRHPRRTRTLWVLPTKAPGKNIITDGIQLCPACLSEGGQPYFRRQWRLAFHTFCPVHDTMMLEICPSCRFPIAYHRHDCSVELEKAGAISLCFNCGVDFRNSQPQPPEEYLSEILEHYRQILMEFQSNTASRFDLAFFTTLHQLCKIMVSIENKNKLREHVACSLGILPRKVVARRTPFYWRGLTTRYHVISLALWLMMDPVDRITDAWKAGAIKYSTLVKDFPDAPQWFIAFARKLNRQESKLREVSKRSFNKTS